MAQGTLTSSTDGGKDLEWRRQPAGGQEAESMAHCVPPEHFSEHFLSNSTVAKFIPVTPIIPDRATAVSLTFLPDGIAVEPSLEFSESCGWVQDRLTESGLRGPYGVGSAQGATYWVSPFFILVLSLRLECLPTTPFSRTF